MSSAVKYGLARIGLFVICGLVAIVALPSSIDLLLKLIIALAASAALSWFFLRRLRDEVADGLAQSSQRRGETKERLRRALNGDDED